MNHQMRIDIRLALLLILATLCSLDFSFGFIPRLPPALKKNGIELTIFFLVFDPDAEIDRGLQRARALLEKSKAKLAAKEENKLKEPRKEDKPETSVPFFASQQSKRSSGARDEVIKARDEKTGLVTADGEKMAQISEEEEWEIRSLLEVFENEVDENGDVYAEASQQLASRDVAASIWNLRKKLQTEDYSKIFDKRNHFIGDI